MKNLLLLSPLAIAAAFAAAQIASLAGFTPPATLNAGNALLAFVIALSALLLHADYARRPSLALSPRRQSAPAAPRVRRGYSIRRGSEAARLAPPPARVVAFPAAPTARSDRAA